MSRGKMEVNPVDLIGLRSNDVLLDVFQLHSFRDYPLEALDMLPTRNRSAMLTETLCLCIGIGVMPWH